MANVVTVQATITGDASSLIRALQQAQNANQQVAASADAASSKGKSAWNSMVGGIGKVVGVAAAAAGVVGGIVGAGAVKAGLDRLGAIQDDTEALTTMLGNAASASDLVSKALAVVQGTPFAFPQFAQATQQLIAFGYTADTVPPLLTAIADAASATGAGSAGVDQLTGAFENLSSQGKLTGQTVQQFANGGVNAVGLVANALHVTTGQAQDLISSGMIPASQAVDILMKGIENGSSGAGGSFAAMGGAAKGAADSISGSLDNLKTGFARMGASALAPFQTTIPAAINSGLIPAMDAAGKVIGGLMQSIANSPGMASFLTWLGTVPGLLANLTTAGGPVAQLFDSMRSIFGVLAPLLSPLTVAFTILQGVLPGLQGPVQALATALGTMATTVIPPLAAALTNVEAVLGAAFAGAAPALINALTTALTILTPIVAGLSSFIADNAGTLVTLGGVVAGVVVSVKAFQAGITAVKTAQAAWTTATDIAKAATLGFQAAQEGVAGVQAVFKTATEASTAAQIASKVAMVAGAAAAGIATAAQWAWNAAMDANPVMLIVLAIAALIAIVVLLVTHWNDVMNVVKTVTDFIVTVWNNVMSFLGTVFSAIGKWVMTYIVQPWMNGFNQIVGFIQGVAAIMVSIFQAIAAPFVAIWNGIVAVVQWVWNLIMTIVVSTIVLLVAGIMTFLQPLIAWWNATWQAISDFFAATWNAIVAFVVGVGTAIANAIMPPIEAIASWWSGVWQGISDFVSTIWNAIVTFVSAYIQAVASVIGGVLNTISGVWNSVWGAISSFVSGIWNGIVGFVSGYINTVVGIIRGVGSTINSVWQGIWNGVSSFVKGIWDGVVGFVKGGINGIIDAINGIVGGINAMADAAKTLTGGAINMHVGKIPHLAKGGQVSGAGYALVGEHGPEVVGLPKGATVYPNSSPLPEDMGGSGDTYNIDLHTSNVDADTVSEMVVQKIRFVKGR